MKSVDKVFTNQKALIILEVELEDSGKRLDESVKSYLKSQSRQRIKQMIKNGQIKIINRKTSNKVHTKIRHMDLIEVFRDNDCSFIKTLSYLYEDEYLIAVNKPKGMPVHPTGIHQFNVVTTILEEELGIKIYPVHRLDIKTSGVLVLAKSEAMAKKMGELFSSKKILKTYQFIAHRFKNSNLPTSCNEKILRELEGKISLKSICDPSGKTSQTLFKDIEYFDDHIKGIAIPITGRLHQIRCHLSFLGFPIIGDELYGNDKKNDSLELYCISLKFKHPIFKEDVLIKV